jgi:cell division protein FtsB
MIDFQEKKQFNKILYSKATLVILLVIIIFLARSTYDIYKKYQISVDDYTSVKKDYDSLNGRKAMLTSEINKLNTDGGVDEEIMSKFNVAKPGETVVTVIDATDTSQSAGNSSQGSFWSNFFGLFKK